MIKDTFSIDNFNVISDDNYYYFFRALNMGDNSDIENKVILDENNNIFRIRTDRERYELTPKYNEYSNLTLEEIFDHIKMHHRRDTNCISLTSNANVAAMYGRGYYKDKYVMVKVPKNELGKDVIDAGFYMLSEVNNRINNIVNNNELDNTTLYYLSLIENASTQDELNNVINYIKTNINAYEFDDSIYEKGIEFTSTTSLDYSALNEKQNFYKNKTIAKLDIINKNIIKNVSNRFLIQTIGNAFSSLELTHYKDILQDKIIELPKEIIDIFSLLQQLPKDNQLVIELKQELLNNISNLNISNLTNFNYENLDINIDEEYTIENMYNLTNGTINFKDSYNLYKKSFYLSKSRLRTINSINNLNKIINNPKYYELFTYLQNNSFGVEPEIFTKLTSNKLKISESVSIDITKNEMELFNFIRKLSKEELNYVINNRVESLKYYLSNFNLERINLDKETYYATSLVELFDWKKLGIDNLSLKHKNNIINKLKDHNVVELYNQLKNRGIKEKDISNVLLTTIIKEKDINEDINLKDTFSLEELEDFLGYYQLKGTKLKLRTYQASAKRKIDKCLKEHNFTSAILPTGAGKSFVSLAEMLKYKNKEILYLAPNKEILNQIKDYIIEYIYGYKNVMAKDEDDVIKEVFPNLILATYAYIKEDNKDNIIDHKYDLIIFDELHRTGAHDWNKKLLKLLSNQSNNTKVLGITATPQRDADYVNMADYWAKYFGYTEDEIIKGNHLAVNMELEDAIKLGYVVNPKVVECEYSSLENGGLLDGLLEQIKTLPDDDRRNELLKKHDILRRKLDSAKGVEQVIGENVKLGDKVIVFCPILSKSGKVLENEFNDNAAKSEDTINMYIQKLKEYLMTYYNKTEEEIESMVEFNSMLGDYGRATNRRQLQFFEQDNNNKIKFMVVIDKLNEGVHTKGVNKLIWFRPLDENSKILMLQQFGRIIKSKDPKKELTEDDRPMAIDLAGNVVRVNLSKKEKVKASDLDKLKLVMSWIDLNNRIPEVNSLDKVERTYGRSLKKIKEKYLIYIDNNNLLDNLENKQKIETLEILRLGNDIDLWNYQFEDIIKEEKNIDKDLDDDLDMFELTGILKDFVDLSKEVNSRFLSFEQRLVEYIELLNSGYEPQSNDPETKFSDGNPIKQFWYYNKDKIVKELDTNSKYQQGYELAKETIKRFKEKLSSEQKLAEYIELLNKGYEPKRNDLDTKFSDGKTPIGRFWVNNRDKIAIELDTNPRYQQGYELAKETIKRLKENLSFEQKLEEYIELLNSGYEPKSNDLETKFSDGEIPIGHFWVNNRDKIAIELDTNPKYQQGYELAKETIKRLKEKLSSEQKLAEYIELLNKGYEPQSNDPETKFSDGNPINKFWSNSNNKDKIVKELDTNPKYQQGYELAKETIKRFKEKLSSEQKLAEYIELLNKGYEPKYNDPETKFSDGNPIKHFWYYNKDKIAIELDINSKYQQGYELAKAIVKSLNENLSFEQKLAEYIELLNKGYEPKRNDLETKFSDGNPINQFWSNNGDKIAIELDTNPRYQQGYELAKETIERLKEKLSFEQKLAEYIELLNKGYEPKSNDPETKFSNGNPINQFWNGNSDKIAKELDTNPKYQQGYELAKATIKSFKENLSPEQKLAEYIELLNKGYKPKYSDHETKFSDGNPINQFCYNKDKIVKELDTNPKYQQGYELAKATIKSFKENLSFEQKLEEYIELLNKGYEPKKKDPETKFSDGNPINYFWKNKDKIAIELDINSNYQQGYELAKAIVKSLNENLSFEQKLAEYIELLNKGYEPKRNDPETKFSDGNPINQFWGHSNNKDKIVKELEENPKYEIGYDVAKATMKRLKEKLSTEQKLEEYINLLNLGYEPKQKDKETTFSDGTPINYFYSALNMGKMEEELNTNSRYQQGYDRAKLIVSVYKEKSRKDENEKNIKELSIYYNIDINKNNSLLKKSCNEVYAKICYLIDTNISICDNKGIVHEIFFMSDINMQAKYNISFKELIEKYVYDSNKFRSV